MIDDIGFDASLTSCMELKNATSSNKDTAGRSGGSTFDTDEVAEIHLWNWPLGARENQEPMWKKVFTSEEIVSVQEVSLRKAAESEIIKLQNEIADNECVICQKIFDETTNYKLQCGHKQWHKKCIADWLKKGNSCPLGCQTEVSIE